LREVDPAREFPITSIRAGAIPGTHVVTYDGPHDTVALSHVARSRRGFAAGALAAAEWLPAHAGVHDFEAMLFGGPG
jgi:4-hydroxy-tetrahydrodipicolinate reductase